MNLAINNQESLLSAAMHLLDAGELELVLEVLQKVLSINPDCIKAHVMRASVYQRLDDLKQAESSFRFAYSLSPSDPDVLRGLGFFLVSQERFDEAQPILRALFLYDPNDAGVAKALFKSIPINSGYKAEIKNLIEFAWSKNKKPDMAALFARRLSIYELYDESIKILNDALTISKTASLLDNLGGIHLAKHEYDKSISCLLEALSLEPQNDLLFNHLSIAYVTSGQKDKAIDAIDKAISLNPGNYDNYSYKSYISFVTNDPMLMLSTANACISILEALPKDNPDRKSELGINFSNKFSSQIKLGMVAEAFNDIELARATYPNLPSLYSTPAKYLVDQQKFQDALDILDSAKGTSIQENLFPLRFTIFHLLNRPDEALDLIKPPSSLSKLKIDNLINEAVRLYINDQVNTALSIHRQLTQIYPDNVRLLTNLSYMLIGNRNYSEAKEFITKVFKLNSQDIYQSIATCNLIYIHVLVGDFNQSIDLVDDALNSKYLSESAILRVPFYVNNSVLVDYYPHSARSIIIKHAILGCGIAAALGLNKIDQAEIYLDEFKKEDNFDIGLCYLLEGSITLAKGNLPQFNNLIEQMLISKASKVDKKQISAWLSDYQNKLNLPNIC